METKAIGQRRSRMVWWIAAILGVVVLLQATKADTAAEDEHFDGKNTD